MPQMLVVEDNANITALYSRLLFQYDYVSAQSAEEAIAWLQQEPFRVVILDLHLADSGSSGFSVLRFIRRQSELAATRVLVISSDDGLRKSCEAIGIDGWMTKPVSVQAFVDHIEALLPQWS